MTTDCLLIGYNDIKFEEYVGIMRSLGKDDPSYRDFHLGFISHGNRHYRALDILTHFYYEDRTPGPPFHNADILWPVIAYLGTFLHRRGFCFDYINLFHMEKEKLKQKLIKDDILTIAVTTTIYTAVHPIMEIVDFVRRYNREARIVIGGPYISKQSRVMEPARLMALFQRMGADFYIISKEGEAALAALIKALKTGSDPGDIPNMALRRRRDYLFTAASSEDNPLAENLVDYSLFTPKEIGGIVGVRTSKSCPFACAYCGFHEKEDVYSFLPVEIIKKELHAIRKAGRVRYLNFIDDTLNVPRSRFKNLLRLMIREKYDFRWHCFYRCDFGDEETIDLMKRAGCENVFVGIESANDDMLKRMNKTSRRKDYLKAIPLLKKAGISVPASVIIGFPGETEATVRETVELIEEIAPDFYRAQIWWCDPTTPIWKERRKYGIEGFGFHWSHNTMDSKTACYHFEKAYLSIRHSIWVPEPNFNPYGLYYLKYRGMTNQQVKTFLTFFNHAVKDKMLHLEQKPCDADLLKGLRLSCHFKDDRSPDFAALESVSADRFSRSEAFWRAELEGGAPMTESIRGHELPGRLSHGRQFSGTVRLASQEIAGLERTWAAPISIILLAWYAGLLLYDNCGGTTLAAAIQEEGFAPIILKNSASLKVSDPNDFSNLVKTVQSKASAAFAHEIGAFYFLSWHRYLNGRVPRGHLLAVGYIEESEAGGGEEKAFRDGILDQVRLVLHVLCGPEGLKIRFVAGPDGAAADMLEDLERVLIRCLEDLKNGAGISFDATLEPAGGKRRDDRLIARLGTGQFNF